MKILKELKFFNDNTGKEIELDDFDDNFDRDADYFGDLEKEYQKDDESLADEDNWFLDSDREVDDSELEDLQFQPQFDDNEFDDNEFEKSPFDQDGNDELDMSEPSNDSQSDNNEFSSKQFDDSEDFDMNDDVDGDEKLFSDEEIDSTENSEDSEDVKDQDYQGTIRTVQGAYLVYKRQDTDGTYNELWIYNIGKDLKTETSIKRSILAGTDIPPAKNSSPDGSQRVESHSLGNVQFLNITGLPN